MEELDKLSLIVGIQEVNNLVNYITEIKALASNRNITIKEIDYIIKTLYKVRTENDIMNGVFYTELKKEDFIHNLIEITLFGIKINLRYLT